MERIKYVGAAAVAADTSDRRIIGAANALTGPTVCHDVVQTVHFSELATASTSAMAQEHDSSVRFGSPFLESLRPKRPKFYERLPLTSHR